MLYLRSENPLSNYRNINKEKDPVKTTNNPPSSLYYEIDNYLQQSQDYINPTYNITLLANHFEKKRLLFPQP